MTPLAEALMFNGITPPSEGKAKTTCPMCSHTRRKSQEKCLRIFTIADRVSWSCFHCGWKDGDRIQ